MIASALVNGKLRQPPVKSACLACRSTKTRCDGKSPCRICSNKGRECLYRPSRRGGSMKSSKRRNPSAQEKQAPQITSPNATFDGPLENIYNLEDPWNNLRNLDLLTRMYSYINEDIALETHRYDLEDTVVAGSDAHDERVHLIRAYNSEADILNAYYIFIHPYFPILPPPTSVLYNDQPMEFHTNRTGLTQLSVSDLPFSATSPLSQALLAMFTLIPHPNDRRPNLERSIEARRIFAQIYSSSALQKIEDDIGCLTQSSITSTQFQDFSPAVSRRQFHAKIPLVLENILALLVLSMYEFCQRGNLSKMRTRANYAMTIAIDLGLHHHDQTGSDFAETCNRAWWMAVFMNYQSSIVNFVPPIISIDDPRIETPFPSFQVSPEPWPLLSKALEVLYESSILLRDVSQQLSKSSSLSPSLQHRLRDLDSKVRSYVLNSDSEIKQARQGVPEIRVVKVLWMVARFSIHSSWIKLHRIGAFSDIPFFFSKYCDLTAVNPSPLWASVDHSTDSVTPVNVRTVSATTKYQLRSKSSEDTDFPFEIHDSTIICLKSALVTVRVCRQLPKPETDCGMSGGDSYSSRFQFYGALPFFSCCAIQSCYVMLMIIYKVKGLILSSQLQEHSYLFSHPESETQVQDAERLIEELRNGLAIMIKVLENCRVAFEAIDTMVDELQCAFDIAFPSLV
ncbi:Zn(II)2Cys6 transcription factor [Xylogone sp. PMI_703]|nr:Zn(II)2Cys6 transcription factor [Xylogone sp. PMI_703]